MDPTLDARGIQAFAHPARNVAAMNIEQGMTIADFGAGSGAYALLFAEAVGPSGRVYAVDVQRDLLRRLRNEAQRRGLKQLETVWGDVEREQGSMLKGGLVDIVLLSNILFQLAYPKYALQEAARVVKPDGRVIIVEWDDPVPENPHHKPLIGPRKEHVVHRARALELAQEAGLAHTSEFHAGAHHYGLTFSLQSA